MTTKGSKLHDPVVLSRKGQTMAVRADFLKSILWDAYTDRLEHIAASRLAERRSIAAGKLGTADAGLFHHAAETAEAENNAIRSLISFLSNSR